MKASNSKKSHSHPPGEACSICGVKSEKQNPTPLKNTIDELRHKVVSIVGKDPAKVGKVLSDWINTAENRKSKKKL